MSIVRKRIGSAVALLAIVSGALVSTVAAAGDGSVVLTGGEETPPVATAAAGEGTITVKPDMTVSGHVVTRGIVGTMAHIHVGEPGKAGPPIIVLKKVSDSEWAVPDGTKLTDEQFKSYKAGNLYVNVHTDAHKGGEIRAQIAP